MATKSADINWLDNRVRGAMLEAKTKQFCTAAELDCLAAEIHC